MNTAINNFTLTPGKIAVVFCILPFLSIVLSILIGYSSTALLVLTIGFAACWFLFTWNRLSILKIFLATMWFAFPPVFDKIGGVVGINWFYNTGLSFVLSIYALALLLSNSWDQNHRKLLFLVIAFVVFCGLSITWAISPRDSLRYYPKLVMFAALFIVSGLEKKLNVDEVIRIMLGGAVMFLVVSVMFDILFREILWDSRMSEYFQGVSGRYVSKYFASFVCVFSFALWFVTGKARYIVLALANLILLTFILQRGTIAATLIGLSVLAFSIKMPAQERQKVVLFRLALVTVGAIGFLWLFLSDKGAGYMFFDPSDRSVFISTFLRDGLFESLGLINFRGRLEFWGLFEDMSLPFFGFGFGSTPVLIENAFGTFIELHNDILQYLIELGPVGYFIFLGMWFFIIRLGWSRRNSSDPILRVCAITTLGFGVAMFLNSAVDHVMDYYTASGCLGIIAGLLVRRDSDVHHKGSDPELRVGNV